jgi:hypothetical protein
MPAENGDPSGQADQERAPINTQAAAPWPHRHSKARARRTGLGLLLALAVLLTAAWAIPPLLDWGRFRNAIAAFAGAELGRPVVIGGDVALRLFPEAVLTASDITVPDTGDGMSARIASLRLEVAIGPLLAGRLVMRDLVLGSPVLTLPWPLPGSIVDPARPNLPHAFAAHVENGTVQAGHAVVTGITAAIHGGNQPSEAQEAGPVATFGAEGFAAFDGQRWRFTTALGAPDADGVSPVDLAVQGQGPAHDTGGAIQGTLVDGVLQGRLRAAGSDLSLLIPASALAWRAEAPFTASGERVESGAMTLSLGGAPATAGLSLQLSAPTRLDGHLHAASLDLDGWSRLLTGRFASFTPPAIPMRLDIGADSARLLGGTLGPVSGALLFDGAHAAVEGVAAQLPGGAKLHFSGGIGRFSDASLAVQGPATLDAPDLHATLAWLRGLAPHLIDAVPAEVLHTARLAGEARLAPGRMAVSHMSGQLDDSHVSGGFELAFGQHPHVSVDAAFDHLVIDNWLHGLSMQPGIALQSAAKQFAGVETDLHLRAATADWGGEKLASLALDATTGAAGLSVAHAAASLPDMTLSLSGTLAADGRVVSARAHAAAPDAARLLARLPPAWRLAPGLWHGPAQLSANADGPPNALGLQLRAELADLVVEADQTRDTLAGTADTTFTGRHPGVPFLLESLGLPGAEPWIGAGSLAILAHLHSAPGLITLTDLTLDAADLFAHAHGTLRGGAAPLLTLDIVADQLRLPGWADLTPVDGRTPAWAPQDVLGGLESKIHFTAGSVMVGGHPFANDVTAEIDAAGGDIFVDVPRASVAGGTLTTQAAIDTAQTPPASALRLQLAKASISGPLTALPIGLDAGDASLDLDLTASGATSTNLLGSLSGSAHVALRDAGILGVDLTALDRSLTTRPGPLRAPQLRASVLQALASGETAGLSGNAEIVFDHGIALLSGTNLGATEGVLSVDGKVALPARMLDVTIGVTPSVPGAPHFAIRLAGPAGAIKPAIDLGTYQPVRKPKRRR